MAIIWDENLSVNVKEIDKQHQDLIKLVNDLYQAFYDMKLEKELEGIIGQLITFAKYHFATEEKYFDMFNYELTQEHKAKHREMDEKIFKLQQRFIEEGKGIVTDMIDFAEDWLSNHIAIEDKKYAKCFNEHGLF